MRGARCIVGDLSAVSVGVQASMREGVCLLLAPSLFNSVSGISGREAVM